MFRKYQGVHEIKNKPENLFKDRQFVFLTQIMIIFYMKSFAVIILSMK